MTRRLALLALFLACTTWVGAATAGRQRPIYRSGVDVVTVDVSVRSADKPVTGLTAADFEVLDNEIGRAHV